MVAHSGQGDGLAPLRDLDGDDLTDYAVTSPNMVHQLSCSVHNVRVEYSLPKLQHCSGCFIYRSFVCRTCAMHVLPSVRRSNKISDLNENPKM